MSDANRTGTNQRSTGGSAGAQRVLCVRGSIDDIGTNALLTGSDEFVTGTLDPAWTVTNAVLGAINPLIPPVTPRYSATERKGVAGVQIGGLFACGSAGLSSGTAAWFGRSLGALADGDSLTITIDMPTNYVQGFTFLGISTTADPTGVATGALVFPQSGTALFGVSTAGAFVNSAGTLPLFGNGGGQLSLTFWRIGATVYVGMMNGDGEWSPSALTIAVAQLGTFTALALGSNDGNQWLTRFRWVRHTRTSVDVSWPWERIS